MKMTNAEDAIRKLSQVSKLAMALRQAGRESDERVAKPGMVRESSESWKNRKTDEPER